jgi:hypothetical protein
MKSTLRLGCIFIFLILALCYTIVKPHISTAENGNGNQEQPGEKWYPDVKTIEDKEYVLREDFDYVYHLVETIENADLELVEMPTVEIVSTKQGQLLARMKPEKNKLRVGISYIEKSIQIPSSWIEGKVIFDIDWEEMAENHTYANQEKYKDYWSLLLTAGPTYRNIKGPAFGASIEASIYTPYLWLFRGFISGGYEYGYNINTELEFHMPTIKIGIMFYYNFNN